MNIVYRCHRLCLAVMVICCAAAGADDTLGEKPPGEFFPLRAKDHRDAPSFRRGEAVVGTTYFYWYDVESRVHIIDGDGSDSLTTHPADMDNISYKRASWHKTQLEDMVAAGVDFLMPVYWGVPGKHNQWSFVGLPPLVQAHDEICKEGVDVPAIGMFYDTSILKHNGFIKDGGRYHVDLTTDFGKEWFYTPIRDFFRLRSGISSVLFRLESGRASTAGRSCSCTHRPSRRRRTRNNSTTSSADSNPSSELCRSSSNPPTGKARPTQRIPKGPADATYSWGGAVSGPLIYRQVAALGPGYDHTAVPGRKPLIVDRRDGQTYVDRWLKILALNPKNRPSIVHVETWNEWHEGTDVRRHVARRHGPQGPVVVSGCELRRLDAPPGAGLGDSRRRRRRRLAGD